MLQTIPDSCRLRLDIKYLVGNNKLCLSLIDRNSRLLVSTINHNPTDIVNNRFPLRKVGSQSEYVGRHYVNQLVVFDTSIPLDGVSVEKSI